MDTGTNQAPLFLRSAEEIAQRFEADGSLQGREIRSEALALVAFFERWKAEHPTNAQRVDAIQRLLELTRRSAEHGSRR